MNRGCDDNNFSVPTPNGPSNIVVTEKMLHFSADTHAGGSGEPPTCTRPPTPNGPSNIVVTEKMSHFSADTHAGGSGEPPTLTRLKHSMKMAPCRLRILYVHLDKADYFLLSAFFGCCWAGSWHAHHCKMLVWVCGRWTDESYYRGWVEIHQRASRCR